MKMRYSSSPATGPTASDDITCLDYVSRFHYNGAFLQMPIKSNCIISMPYENSVIMPWRMVFIFEMIDDFFNGTTF